MTINVPEDDAGLTRENAVFARRAIGLLTEDEAAAVLQLNSVSTLATWRSQGKGPQHVKLGKRVFYLVGDIQQWATAEAQRQHANDNVPPAAAA